MIWENANHYFLQLRQLSLDCFFPAVQNPNTHLLSQITKEAANIFISEA